MVTSTSLYTDVLFYIKNDLLSNITDPISASRPSSSKFVVTSYPKVMVNYPVITLKIVNYNAKRAGMQTTNMDGDITLEIRVWARNEKEKDTIYNQVIERLRNIQFTSSTGSVANGLHDFTIQSSVEVDEEGDKGIKSRIGQIFYRFYNFS